MTKRGEGLCYQPSPPLTTSDFTEPPMADASCLPMVPNFLPRMEKGPGH